MGWIAGHSTRTPFRVAEESRVQVSEHPLPIRVGTTLRTGWLGSMHYEGCCQGPPSAREIKHPSLEVARFLIALVDRNLLLEGAGPKQPVLRGDGPRYLLSVSLKTKEVLLGGAERAESQRPSKRPPEASSPYLSNRTLRRSESETSRLRGAKSLSTTRSNSSCALRRSGGMARGS